MPMQHNDATVHASGYDYPSPKMKGHNTPNDVNAITYRPLHRNFPDFSIGTNTR